jgi:peptidyl-prolyl cis-trans isomerase SurA
MIKAIGIKYLIISLFFFFNFYKNDIAYSEQVEILFKVNEEIVTNIDIQKELKYLRILNEELNYLDKTSAFKVAKKSLITEKIKLVEIKKIFETNQNNQYLEKVIDQFYASLNLRSVEDIENFLKINNFSKKFIKEKLEIETQWNELIFLKYRNQIDIDTKKLKKRLENELTKKKQQKSYHLYEILFSPKNTTEINLAYSKIKESIDKIGFKNTSNLYSISDTSNNGGEIGWVNEFQLNDKIIKELKYLKIGQLTNPITTANGQLILKIEDIKTVEINLNFDKEFEKYVTNEKNKQLNQFSKIYFKKLKENTKIYEK